jgi:hypothetical protein
MSARALWQALALIRFLEWDVYLGLLHSRTRIPSFFCFSGPPMRAIFSSANSFCRDDQDGQFTHCPRPLSPFIPIVDPKITPRRRRPTQGSSTNRESWKYLIYALLGTLTRFSGRVTQGPTLSFQGGWGRAPKWNTCAVVCGTWIALVILKTNHLILGEEIIRFRASWLATRIWAAKWGGN